MKTSLLRFAMWCSFAITGLLPNLNATPVLVQTQSGSIFDPAGAGVVNLGDGAFTTANVTTALIFDTDTGLYSTNNGANWTSTEANYGLSDSGKVELGLFAFNSLSIGSGVTVKVQGKRGLVLASRSTLGFAGTISVAGSVGTSASSFPDPGPISGLGGQGGSGAEGGVRGSSLSSRGLNDFAGAGGLRTTNWDNHCGWGIGYGGGYGWSLSGSLGTVAGGGYGGNGGWGSSASETYKGASYGDNTLTNLFGGSGGGGSYSINVNNYYSRAGGGGGGGALAMVACGKLTVTGTVSAYGAAGISYSDARCLAGAGSGGGVLMAAPEIAFSGTINAKGGNASAGSQSRYGGSGGGGRVAFYAGAFGNGWTPQKWTPVDATGMSAEDLSKLYGLTYSGTVNVSPGTGGNPGIIGTFYVTSVLPPRGTLIIVR